jgi:hypothetical protein
MSERDPNYFPPNSSDPYRRNDASLPPDGQPWSNATWGWMAAVAAVVLVLIFAFGRGGDNVASNDSKPSATTGQRTIPAPPPTGPQLNSPAQPAPDQTPTSPRAPGNGENVR